MLKAGGAYIQTVIGNMCEKLNNIITDGKQPKSQQLILLPMHQHIAYICTTVCY